MLLYEIDGYILLFIPNLIWLLFKSLVTGEVIIYFCYKSAGCDKNIDIN